MSIIKLSKGLKVTTSKVAYYYNFEGKNGKRSPMARIEGNFFMGGFNMSANKLKAIFDLAPELKKFIKGDYDAELAKAGTSDGVVPDSK